MNAMLHLEIGADQRTPKYKQIINSILSEIKDGTLKRGQRIPSINELSEEYYLSRDTVEKAYNELREQGIIASVRGKGYYISRTDVAVPLRVLLVFNKISAYKKIVYNAFLKTLGSGATVDLHIHHFNARLFDCLISNNLGDYHYYVIMPHFYEGFAQALETIRKIPKDKLLIIDKDLRELSGDFTSVYQDFENDICEALHSGIDLLRKYDKLVLVQPEAIPYPREITSGFRKFCRLASFDFDIIREVDENTVIRRGEAYIVIEETDLVNLIKKSRMQQLRLGRDLGLVSYNETPLKEILADGITVITTDHEKMGETAAQLILEKRREKIKNPFVLIRRNTL